MILAYYPSVSRWRGSQWSWTVTSLTVLLQAGSPGSVTFPLVSDQPDIFTLSNAIPEESGWYICGQRPLLQGQYLGLPSSPKTPRKFDFDLFYTRPAMDGDSEPRVMDLEVRYLSKRCYLIPEPSVICRAVLCE